MPYVLVILSQEKRCSDLHPFIDKSVVFSGSSGFLHHENWPPRYSWNIVESGVKHHQTNKKTFIDNDCEILIFIPNTKACELGARSKKVIQNLITRSHFYWPRLLNLFNISIILKQNAGKYKYSLVMTFPGVKVFSPIVTINTYKFICVFPLEIQLSRDYGWDPTNRFKLDTFVCLSQDKTWISNVTCRGIFSVQ